MGLLDEDFKPENIDSWVPNDSPFDHESLNQIITEAIKQRKEWKTYAEAAKGIGSIVHSAFKAFGGIT